jgi:tight adherence protein C
MSDQLIITICIFGAAALLTFVVIQFVLVRDADGKLKGRLSARGPAAAEKRKADQPKVKEFITNIGEAAARPFMPTDTEKQYVLRRNLARAGIYSPGAARAMIGAKVILMGGGLVLGYVVGSYFDMSLLLLPVGGLLGYLLPKIWLKMRTTANQQELTNGLADALDLMVVCIEAGLTVDAAMQRVGQELVLAHASLSREMGLTHMETRVGLSRVESLRNMGQRTGNASLISLASMLIQADRFGTSIADALRVHSETLRINRQMAAEEVAGKAAVKMSFPLVLCIFPSTFIILAGPVVIQLMNSQLFK